MKNYTKEEISEVIEKKPIKHTALTIDFMDSYIACFKPNDTEQWIKECLKIEKVARKINGVETQVKDTASIREYFLKTYFPTETKEARKAAKEEAKAKKKNMSDEDKLRAKIEELKKKYK